MYISQQNKKKEHIVFIKLSLIRRGIAKLKCTQKTVLKTSTLLSDVESKRLCVLFKEEI